MAYDILEVDLLFEDLIERSKKTINNLQEELANIRAGRANAKLLDKVTVNYYGVQTPLNQMANLTVAEARVLVINVWDTSALKDVEKAIIDANIGIFPTNDGKVLRLVFPELTEERRKNLVKGIKTSCENTKIALRNIRRDILGKLKTFEKDNIITEDDLLFFEKEVDKKVNEFIDNTDTLISEKEKEIMAV